MKRLAGCLAISFILTIDALATSARPVLAAVQIMLPLQRTAYQTNEQIDIAVLRSSASPLAASTLHLSLLGADGSKMEFTFPVKAAVLAAPVSGAAAEARATEHLHLNGWLIRPGRYTVEVSVGGAHAAIPIEIYSHVRQSSFKLIDWGSRASGKEQGILGSMGFNLLYPSYGGLDTDEMIRGGEDYMWCCTMSGGHQMDLRPEADWSDPYVLGGGAARVARRALEDRTAPNCIGVHFYDEPGLTWWKYPKNGIAAPFNIPSQDRSYRSAFNEDPIQWTDVNPDDPASAARWMKMNRWKEEFLDAAWKDASFAVSYVRPDYLSATQSEYGWSAYADGYYFNAVRSLPVISGHGGYDDGGPGYFNPGWFYEMGRIRDLNKPAWYLPTWYGDTPADRFRMEQYLSFIENLQGMAVPPDMTVYKPETTAAAEGIVESNKTLARLGTIFTTMPVTRPPVAMLYSLSQDLNAEMRQMRGAADLNPAAYEGGGHRSKTLLAYLAAKLIHVPIFPIVEEDILDGTLAAHHRVVLLPGIDYLPPDVIAALEQYISGGGTVIVSDDSKVKIRGAIPLGCALNTAYSDRLSLLWQQKNQSELAKIDVVPYYLTAAAPAARALKERVEALGIQPDVDCNTPGIVTSRQALGDIEYLFAVNAAYNPHDLSGTSKKNSIRATAASLGFPNDGRPIYDAAHGGPVTGLKTVGKEMRGYFRFGAGEMRVFARTTRPIGGVQVTTPTIFSDYTVTTAPLHVDFTAAVMDTSGRALDGSAPLNIRVIDALGSVRYDLYRATDHGALRMSLPLAVNDPPGNWRIVVRDLLANRSGLATFRYTPPRECGALAGATRRAVFFGRDRENIFRFFRLHQQVTIVPGTGAGETEAANRLAAILKPWDIHAVVMTAADAARPRNLSEAEATTWVGLGYGRAQPGSSNSPEDVGFAVQGPVILIGVPEDNPIIKFIEDQHFLPYQPDRDAFPGPGRGMMAWQLDAVGHGQESITLIAYDAAGLSEAVGSVYEAAAGLDPLTPLILPSTAAVAPASHYPNPARSFRMLWRIILPDRVTSLQPDPAGKITALTEDGSRTTIGLDGRILSQMVAAPDGEPLLKPGPPPVPPAALTASLLSDHVVKWVAGSGGRIAVAYWGGELQLFTTSGKEIARQSFPNDLAGLTWAGNTLIAGFSDGTLEGLTVGK